MGKKIALNVFYNLMLILSVIGMGWAFKNDSLLIVAFFAATFTAVLYFKIQLLKMINKGLKK